jgi:photosystem II stability/assembly factor-like uncharacterized protein
MQVTSRRIANSSKIALQLLVLGLLLPPARAAAQALDVASPSNREAIEASLRNDAALADVYFVDATTGWAVGERGVIWHTGDGGVSWQQQESGASCRLNSVFFIDHRRGWAVGGASRHYGNTTQGVVLRTTDNGETWRPIAGLLVPQLNRVKFFDSNVGIAIGPGNATYPSGVAVTRDAGQSWQPLPTDQASHWLAGEFLDSDTGAVAGPAGQFATIARRQVIHSPLAPVSLRSARAMRLAPATGWLVGDGGLVMSSSDLGHSWQSPPAELPNSAGEQFDFHAVAVHGAHVWIAGSPGTRVFYSADGGQTWESLATGLNTPLRAISFVDAQHGWAVGDLGCILATRDGGKSWYLQRAGGQRAALLAVFAHATDVPLELIAEQGAAESYITAVNVLHGDPASNDRAREALISVGAAAAETTWRFPLPPDDLALQPTEIVAALNRATDGQAIRQMQNHLVRQLRTWRPEVVITHAPASQTDKSVAAMLEELVVQSVGAAADAEQFTELASNVGLPPWQVKRVYGLLPPDSHGDIAILTGRFSPWLGASLAEWAAPSRRLLVTTQTAPPDSFNLRLLTGAPDFNGKTERPNGLFGGIALPHGSDARRQPPDLPANDLEELRRLATRRRHLQKLLEISEGNAAWAGQVTTLTQGVGDNTGAELLYQLAEGYRETSRLDLAADTYFLLARRYPEHWLAEPALVWLVQFYASSEAGHRSVTRGLTNVRNTTSSGEPASGTVALAGGNVELQPSHAIETLQQASATATIGPEAPPAVGLAQDDRLRRAIQLADYLKTARPALYAEPAVRFAEVSAQRQLGYANAAKRYFLTLGQHPQSDPWRRCAETEQWLSKPGDAPPPKSLATCRRTTDRPHLDGQLNEPLWDTADRLRLRTSDGNLQTSEATGQLRLLYDEEFLYLGLTCPRSAGDYRRDKRPRPRDADLQQHDHVTLRFDIDRDFSTAFEFTVDHRGWTRDACWDDSTWNPNWYVAANVDESTWTVEAAVPLSELTAIPPATKHVWAVGARRTLPRVGYEGWPEQKNADDSPDQYGLLIFE